MLTPPEFNLLGKFRGCGAAGSAPAWHAGGQGFESPQLHHVMSRDMLIACLESCLYFFGFECVAFGHSALSGCSFFGPWFDASWLVVGVGVDGEFAEYFSGFSVDDGDVEVVD